MNEEEIIYLDNDSEEKEETKQINDEFVKNLPEWNLEPPYQVIERRNS